MVCCAEVACGEVVSKPILKFIITAFYMNLHALLDYSRQRLSVIPSPNHELQFLW